MLHNESYIQLAKKEKGVEGGRGRGRGEGRERERERERERAPFQSLLRSLAAAVLSDRSRGSVRRSCFEVDRFLLHSDNSLPSCTPENLRNST